MEEAMKKICSGKCSFITNERALLTSSQINQLISQLID